MSNKRKRDSIDEQDDYSSYPEKDLKKELRLLGKEFKEIKGKYYLGSDLINDLIDKNNFDTLSLNFVMKDLDNKFIVQVSPKIKKLRLVRYNNPIDNFPDHITHLETGVLDYPINKLPKSLEYLFVDNNFTKTIKEYPENLKFLRLSKNAVFNADRLPDKLVNLEIPKAVCVDNLPNSIVYLKIDSDVSVDNLPESVKYLSLGTDIYDQNSFNKPIDNLPYSIIKLELGHKFNQSINNLPNKLIELKIGNDFNHPIDNLPQTLRKLELGRNFNQPINNLPNNLESLILGFNFNHPIDNLNPNLKKIELGKNFNQRINSLPNSLESIVFDKYYTLPLDNLPVKLKHIKMNINRYEDLDNDRLPDDEPITIHYATRLKSIDFFNLTYRITSFKFNLKINEQTYLISMDESQQYYNIFDYNNKKIHIKIKSKKGKGLYNDGFSVEFNLK